MARLPSARMPFLLPLPLLYSAALPRPTPLPSYPPLPRPRSSCPLTSYLSIDSPSLLKLQHLPSPPLYIPPIYSTPFPSPSVHTLRLSLFPPLALYPNSPLPVGRCSPAPTHTSCIEISIEAGIGLLAHSHLPTHSPGPGVQVRRGAGCRAQGRLQAAHLPGRSQPIRFSRPAGPLVGMVGGGGCVWSGSDGAGVGAVE